MYQVYSFWWAPGDILRGNNFNSLDNLKQFQLQNLINSFFILFKIYERISIDKERGEKQQEEEEEEQQWIIKQWERASISLIGWHESRDMGGVQSAAAGCGGSFELVGMIIIIVCVFFLK